MKLTRRLLRRRFWLRYSDIPFMISLFTVFLLHFHQFKPENPEFERDLTLFSGRIINRASSGNPWAHVEDSPTGVSPSVFSHSGGLKKRCATGTGNSERNGLTTFFEGIITELPFGRARYDNRRLLRIFDYVRMGNHWESLLSQFDICLATQSSLERLYWLPEVLRNWRGPLSLAVYITSDEEWLNFNLHSKYLEHCFPGFRDQVALHLASPVHIGAFCVDLDKVAEWNVTVDLEQILQNGDCSNPRKFMDFLIETFPIMDKRRSEMKQVYPQNHMRNIARKSCGTEWTFSTDIDIIPRDGMAEMLQQFYESIPPCEKCAFVIPTFEMDETKQFPGTKQEMVEFYNNGSARQFHGKIFASGHRATNYDLWASTNLEDGPVKISHPILSSDTYLYEPFYISPDTIPPFDERFLGYGYTRNSQFQEALLVGWNFTVLTPVFSVHWGDEYNFMRLIMQKKENPGRKVRVEQTVANHKLFKKILKEMELKKREGIF